MEQAWLTLLARSSDSDSGWVGICVYVAIFAFIVLAQVLKKVSPDAMAKRIREMQEARRQGGFEGAPPVVRTLPSPRDLPMAAIPVAQLAPVKKKRKKRRMEAAADAARRAGGSPALGATPLAGVGAGESPALPGGTTTLAAGFPSLQQAVIFSEVLGPPLVLRRGRALWTSPRLRHTGAAAR